MPRSSMDVLRQGLGANVLSPTQRPAQRAGELTFRPRWNLNLT